MVGKLLKYEFKYYLRIIMFLFPVVFLSGILLAFTNIFVTHAGYIIDGNSRLVVLLYFMSFSSTALFFTACYGSILVLGVFGIIRFYKNLFGNEGYLSLTLPVSNTKHIFVKLYTFMFFVISTTLLIMLCAYLGFGITKPIGFIEEIINRYYLIIKFFFGEVHVIHQFLFAFDFIFALLSSAILSVLVGYFSMSVGQMASKAKIVISILVFYGINCLFEIVSSFGLSMFIQTLLIVAEFEDLLIIRVILDFVGDVIKFIGIENLLHIIMFGSSIGSLVLAGLFYLFTNLIMNKKLNLQ